MILEGDCIELMASMAPESVDAIVCDPPYGIGLMGREWDALPPGLDWAAACLRVLKPGGHLIAAGSTRTVHRLVCAVEDAGFEIRDVIDWLYWQGFPKSHAIDKAIDRQRRDRDQVLEVTTWLRQARDRAGVTNDAIDARLGKRGMAGHWTTQASQPQVPTLEQWPLILEVLCDPDVPERIKYLAVELNGRKGDLGQAWHDRALTGQHGQPAPGQIWQDNVDGGVELVAKERRDVPSSDLSARWFGWGTAIKPAREPHVLARKPFTGSVANNVLEHGTGALNIDACRFPYGSKAWPPGSRRPPKMPASFGPNEVYGKLDYNADEDWEGHPLGLFPANVYACAKPSRAEKEAGLEAGGVSLKESAAVQAHGDGAKGLDSPRAGAGRNGQAVRNNHPTVKPVQLYRWLCRLVTPPGGLVLDTFAGSGTTGVAAALEGFRFVGCELDPSFAQIARARMAHGVELANKARAQVDLFDNPPAPKADDEAGAREQLGLWR